LGSWRLANGTNRAACFLGSAGGELAPADLESMMIIDPFSRLVFGAMLMGLLACGSSTRDQARLHVQRNAELDRLGAQTGMAEPWLPHYLNAATTYLSGSGPAPAGSKQPLPGEGIE
jgi:hypothetical protein